MSTVKRSFSALALSLMAVSAVGVLSATPASAEVFQAPYSADSSLVSTTGVTPDGNGCVTADKIWC